jgi:hypothetical protein
MPKLRHAVSGAIYDLEPDGLVRIDTAEGKTGWFNADASWHHGEVKEGDPQIIGWIAGKPRARDAAKPAVPEGEKR